MSVLGGHPFKRQGCLSRGGGGKGGKGGGVNSLNCRPSLRVRD